MESLTAMEIVVFIILCIFFVFAFIIPAGLIATSFQQYAGETKGYIVVIRLLAAFWVYISVTLFTFFLIAMLIFEVMDSIEEGYSISLQEISFSFTVSIIYGFIGWLCCSLTNGGFIHPSTLSIWRMGKPLSIVNSEES